MGIKTMGVLLAILLVPCLASYGEPEGLLQVDIKSWGGERPTHHGLVLKIYPDTNKTPMEVLPSSNPYEISLPLNHRYKIEAYASDMFVDVDFVELTQQNQKVDLSMPIPGSVRFSIVYADDSMPITGASVSLRSGDGTYKYWTNSTTDETGNTIRFWLQPTISEDDYYVVDVTLGDGLLYTYSPVNISPGLSKDVKIVAPWPKLIDQLIVVSVIDSNSEKISGLGKDLVVELYDKNGDKIQSSYIDHKGDAHFSSLKVGTYLLRAVNLDQPSEELGRTTVTLSGKTEPIRIFANTNEVQNETELVSNGLLETPSTSSSKVFADSTKQPSAVPSWIKSVADWWAKGQISDSEFLDAIEYLVNNSIITVRHLQTS
ncbi:MAG TPA: hypothetical protein VIG05_01685 [Candidatus Nitrosotenuis sp.]|jgi:hypothetical protein